MQLTVNRYYVKMTMY